MGETVPDVPGDAEMRKQSAILGHIAEAPTLGWYVSIRAFDQLPRQADPAGATPLESGHDPQESGFAAARRSQYRGDRVRQDRERQVGQDRDVTERNFESLDVQSQRIHVRHEPTEITVSRRASRTRLPRAGWEGRR